MGRNVSFGLLLLLLLLAPFSFLGNARAQASARWGAQTDGTYENPVLPADFSDLDAIRVGDDFYAISSTLQYSPGMAVLHSRDLVHWQLLSHVVPDTTVLSPEMNWDRRSRAGRGIWTGAIRFHEGRFRVFFGTPDEGIFEASALDPAGPWSKPVLVLAGAGWDDPCPFWDEDGRGYLVVTRFAPDPSTGKTYNIHLFSLGSSSVDIASDRVIHQSQGSEANKLYKIHGVYYHFFSEVRAEGRVPMLERAASLAGPWKTQQMLHVNQAVDKEPNQGGLVELADHRWYFLTHQGTGDWEGRAAVLLPVMWHKGWPIAGKPGPDGIGTMVWKARAPLPFAGVTAVTTEDDFTRPQLAPQWEWLQQPRAGFWSLQPGAIRLQAFPQLKAGDFLSTGNILTQRAMRTSANQVTVKLALSQMMDGQHAGLVHFARTSARLEVRQAGGVRTLAFVAGGGSTAGPVVKDSAVWLRSAWDFAGECHFFFSMDGEQFQAIGSAYQLTWGSYRGDRVGLFTYTERASGGAVDFSAFRYGVSSAD